MKEAEQMKLMRVASQRGARMTIMWQWMKSHTSPAFGVADFSNLLEAFLTDHPEASKWFEDVNQTGELK